MKISKFTALFLLAFTPFIFADNKPPKIPHKVEPKPDINLISKTQDPPVAIIGQDITITWKFDVSKGYHIDSYDQGDTPPEPKVIDDLSVDGHGKVEGSTIEKTTPHTAKNGNINFFDFGVAWCTDPCDDKRVDGSSAGTPSHPCALKPAPPNRNKPGGSPNGGGGFGVNGGGGGGGCGMGSTVAMLGLALTATLWRSTGRRRR